MPIGPGKYDSLLTEVMEKTGAYVGVLVILGGNKGNSHCMQMKLPLDQEAHILLATAKIFREYATQLEAEVKRQKSSPGS